MKRILLLLMLSFFVGFLSKLQAQCSVGITKVSVQPVGVPEPQTTGIYAGTCKYTFNVSFHLTYNNGASFVYFTSYLKSDYDALAANANTALDFDCGNKNTPARNVPLSNRLGTSLAQPGTSFLDIGFNLEGANGHQAGTTNVTMLSTYSQDQSVVLIQNVDNTKPGYESALVVTKTQLTSTTDSFSVKNLTVYLNQACGADIDVRTDVFASNANSASAKAQCYVCGLNQLFNVPKITGQKNCTNPRTFNLKIESTNIPIALNYKVYADMNGDGTAPSGSGSTADVLVYDYVASNPDSVRLSSSNSYTYQVFNKNYPYANIAQGNADLVVVVEGNNLTNGIKQLLNTIECTPLPVHFKSFSASRTTPSNVSITWTTSSEQNSRGFNVQKNVGGEWKTIAFVFSQAEGGNSSSDLSYSFKDVNNEKGITQYRIQQVDLDGMAKYSDIKAIRGEGTVGKIVVYPNPSVDGKVNVVFEDNSIRDVQINDMQGRIVKSFKGIANNILVVEKLTSGFYTIKVTNRNTAATSVEKVVVK
jgi:hypothetical protein